MPRRTPAPGGRAAPDADGPHARRAATDTDGPQAGSTTAVYAMDRSSRMGYHGKLEDSATDPVNRFLVPFGGMDKDVKKDIKPKELGAFLAHFCHPGIWTSDEVLRVFEITAEAHGCHVEPFISQIVSTIIRIMSSDSESLHSVGCSKVVCTLSRYTIDPLGTEKFKKRIISSLCRPLYDCLMNTKESVSSGSALCITELISQSNNWQFAANKLVNDISLKVSKALEKAHCQTAAYLGLVVALSEQNPLKLKPYGQSLIKSGFQILDENTEAKNSEMIRSSIQMIRSIMENLDVSSIMKKLGVSIISFGISSISRAMLQLNKGCMPEINIPALQAAAEISTNLVNQISRQGALSGDVRMQSTHEDIINALFVHSSDKSKWLKLCDYAKQNKLTKSIRTPGSAGKHKSVTTSNRLKVILRRSFQLLKNLHDGGLTLGGRFNSKNFVVNRYNTVKFDATARKMVKKIEGEDDDEDHHVFVRMIKDEVFKMTRPRDLLIWLSLVDDCDKSYTKLMLQHISLMHEHQSASVFSSMHDTLVGMEQENNIAYQNVFAELGKKKKYSNWQKYMKFKVGNGFLRATFRYGGRKYTNNPKDLLRLLRNSRQHSMRSSEKVFARVIAEHFPNLMADVQKAMHRQGYLSRLRLKYSMY